MFTHVIAKLIQNLFLKISRDFLFSLPVFSEVIASNNSTPQNCSRRELCDDHEFGVSVRI